ncbi:MAG TPA: Smr/MutS family protein [Alphaproteobacteria bacterium]
MSPKKPPVTAEDEALWHRIADTIKPLPGKQKDIVPPAPPKIKKKKTDMIAVAEPVPVAKTTAPLSWADSEHVTRGDKKRIKQGVLKPTARLDLHGYTVARAEKAIPAFLQKSCRDGHLWVEIITGHGRMKGDDDGVEKGVLKRMLPQWLEKPLNRPWIKRVLDAPQSRGGAVWIALKDA